MQGTMAAAPVPSFKARLHLPHVWTLTHPCLGSPAAVCLWGSQPPSLSLPVLRLKVATVVPDLESAKGPGW
jgi:hypothetical protein